MKPAPRFDVTDWRFRLRMWFWRRFWVVHQGYSNFRVFGWLYCWWLMRSQMGQACFPVQPWHGWSWAKNNALGSDFNAPWFLARNFRPD